MNLNEFRLNLGKSFRNIENTIDELCNEILRLSQENKELKEKLEKLPPSKI